MQCELAQQLYNRPAVWTSRAALQQTSSLVHGEYKNVTLVTLLIFHPYAHESCSSLNCYTIKYTLYHQVLLKQQNDAVSAKTLDKPHISAFTAWSLLTGLLVALAITSRVW